MPKLYLEDKLESHDKKLRDSFYDGVFGTWYSFMMPFIVLPVRPVSLSILHWLILFLAQVLILGLLVGCALSLTSGEYLHTIIFGGLLALLTAFLLKQQYLLYLLILAIPTKICLAFSRFGGDETFAEVHKRALSSLEGKNGSEVSVLDVSTGSCNSLYKHGWMSLNGQYTGLDLSTTMLAKGQELMAARGISVNLVLGDAMALPFESNSFDVVLNYGAINGMADPERALSEMVRVAKPGGLLLFLDEQMYGQASAVEKLYFEKVLSGHNTIHHCPTELLPSNVEDVRVTQIYEFYYICTAKKSSA